MPFFILGINHNTAPVDIRERIVFDESVLPDALQESGSLPGVNENVIVSTCNRTEIVCDVDQEAETGLVAWLHNFHGMDERLAECLFQAREEAAARHLFR
ncbi:MAG TPA: glutamyl-tRNA reductase, partial [Woeseiaceae bacterium]|nr:glutamyl-tRNA reductase [Woeseiaceae bacterium]